MPYVEGQTIHDADSHVMELPGTINPYIDPKFRDRFVELAGPKAILPEWSEKIQAMQDDTEFRAGDEANLLLRKNYQALGAFREAFADKAAKKLAEPDWVPKVQALQDDAEFRAGHEANLLLRKNYQALGAFRAEDRPKALDHFGFASQLVFTTACLSNFGLEQMGEIDLALEAARAHNRMMTEFCGVDRR